MNNARTQQIQELQGFLQELESKTEKTKSDIINIQVTKNVLKNLYGVG